MASDPEGIVDTLHQLARLDPVELGLEAVLDQIVQAATGRCGISGGVGLLLLGPDDQLHYVAVADRRRSLLVGTQLPSAKAPPSTPSSRTSRSPAATLPPNDTGQRSGNRRRRPACGPG